MKSLVVVFGSVAFCSVALVGCAKGNSSSGQPAGSQGAMIQTQGQQTISAKCPMPSILSDSSASRLSSLEEIKGSLHGKYELDEVHVYSVGHTADGKVNGAFYGIASRYVSNESHMGVNKIRSTRMDFSCTDFDKSASVPFFSGITVPVAGVVHFPSGRITIFNENSGTFDIPQFNFPSIADVHFNSFGMMSYKNIPKERVSGPPYISNLYLSDLAGMWPADAKFYFRNSDGFEVRFSQVVDVDDSDLGKGKVFKATSTVLITYKKLIN